MFYKTQTHLEIALWACMVAFFVKLRERDGEAQ